VTGFSFDKTAKAWRQAKFNTDFKYIIAPANDGKSAYSLRTMGEGPGNPGLATVRNEPGRRTAHLIHINVNTKICRANGCGEITSSD
jgi:hypothetical protein